MENTGDEYRPDLLIIAPDNVLYITELTVGFETNLHKNVKRKDATYKELIKHQNKNFKWVKIDNLSISSLGLFDKERLSFLEMLGALG